MAIGAPNFLTATSVPVRAIGLNIPHCSSLIRPTRHSLEGYQVLLSTYVAQSLPEWEMLLQADPGANPLHADHADKRQAQRPYGEVCEIIVGRHRVAKEASAEHLVTVDCRIEQDRVLRPRRQPVYHEERARYRDGNILKWLYEALRRL